MQASAGRSVALRRWARLPGLVTRRGSGMDRPILTVRRRTVTEDGRGLRPRNRLALRSVPVVREPTLPQTASEGAPAPIDTPSGVGDGWRSLLGEFLGFGGEQHLEPPEQPYADALSKEERQRVRSVMYRGRPVWDERSAQYAVVVARAAERAHPFGVVASTVLLGIIAIALLGVTLALALDGSLFALLPGLFALTFAPSAVWLPSASRNIHRSTQLSRDLLPDGFAIPPATPARRGKRWLRLLGLVVGGALVFGVTRVLLMELFGGDDTTREAFGSGAFVGVLFVVCGEAFRGLGRWRQSR